MSLLSRPLLAFLALAEELHFGRAAQRLHISQPPFSQLIREFERATGAQLFTRTTRSVQLTPAGRLMQERARQLLADAEGTLEAVGRLARGESGSLTLGFTHSTVYRVLPRLLRAYREQSPGVTLAFRQQTSDVLVEGLRAGRIDVALARLSLPMMEGFETAVVAQDPMVLLLPAGHPLAARKVVPVRALEGVPFIHYTQEGAGYFRELVDAIFATAGVQPRQVHASYLPTLFALVEAGMGVALVPDSVLPARGAALASRPVSGIGQAAATLHAAWRAYNPNPAIASFVEMLEREPPS